MKRLEVKNSFVLSDYLRDGTGAMGVTDSLTDKNSEQGRPFRLAFNVHAHASLEKDS